MVRCHDGGVFFWICGGTWIVGICGIGVYFFACNDLSIVEYQDKFIIGGLFQKEGTDLVKDFALVDRGFKVHGRDTHAYRLKNALFGPMNAQ